MGLPPIIAAVAAAAIFIIGAAVLAKPHVKLGDDERRLLILVAIAVLTLAIIAGFIDIFRVP